MAGLFGGGICSTTITPLLISETVDTYLAAEWRGVEAQDTLFG